VQNVGNFASTNFWLLFDEEKLQERPKEFLRQQKALFFLARKNFKRGPSEIL
jgi:hypothetical protein